MTGALIWKNGLFPIFSCIALLLFPSPGFAVDYFSRVAGPVNWTANNTWSTVGCGGAAAGGAEPGVAAGDTATICNGHTVVLDRTVTAANALTSLTINAGGVLTFGDNTSRTLPVTGLTSNAGTLRFSGNRAHALTATGGITNSGAFDVNATSDVTHILNVGGDIANTGTFNLATDANSLCNVTFNRNGNQTVSGAGTYTFNRIILNMGAAQANILDMQSNMTAPANFLTITNGTYKHSNTSAITPWTADPNIPANGGFWLNGGSATSGNFNVTVNGGLFQVSAGTMTVGTANTNLLRLNNFATTLFQMDGGALTVTGGINSSSTTGAGTFTMSGGTILLHNVSAGAVESFMLGSATTLNWSGGTITCQIGNNAADDVNIRSATQNVTGGTLQFGNASTSGANPYLLTNTTGGAVNVWNLVLASGIAKQTQIGSTVNVLNDLTINTGNTMQINAAANAINIGGGNASGNFTNSGTYTATGNTVTFTGTFATPALGGTSATTFNNLVINKAAGNLSIASGTPSPTVSATLTLTSGRVITAGASCAADTPIIVANTGAIAGGSSTSYVQGALRKNFNAGATLNFRAGAGLDEFPVGTASAYSPIEVTSGTTSTAGNVVVCVTATDHPQMSQANGGGIDILKSVNRYWSMTSTGLTLSALMDATFKFVGGDVDGGASTGNFIVERYNGSAWNPTTLVTAAATSTRAQNIDLTSGTNDCYIGEPITGFPPTLGAFNAFDTTTPAGAVIGNLQTKQAGVAFTVRLVRILNNAVNTGYNQAGVTVELYDALDNSGGYVGSTACRSTWSAIAGTSQTVTFAAGLVNATFTVPNVYRDARVHVVKTGAGAGEGCSSDRFTIRPQSLTASAHDANWQTAGTARTLNNTGASGGNVHAASDPAAATPRPFTLRATSAPGTATNYDGAPTTVSGFPACGTLCTTVGMLSYTAGSWTGAGTRDNATAHYSEAGTFTLEIEDATYASVDSADGSSAALRTIPATATAEIGRFVPDRFDFTGANTPQFRTFNTAACASRSFTYIGQRFWYTPLLPSATVRALNAAGAVTANYTGSLFKLDDVGVTGIVETYSNNATGPALDTTLIGTASLTPGSGTGTYTAAAGGTIAYQRSTTSPIPAVNNPFTANISLSVTATDNSESAVGGNGDITALAPLVFDGGGSGILFDSGAAFRYGRLKLSNAYGSELIDLPVPVEAQYYNGTVFITNADDDCTTLVPNNVKLTTGLSGVTATLGGAFVGGKGSFRLTKPSPAAKGVVDICVDLDVGAGGDATCQATTPADKTYLQGKWSGASYDKDPVVRGTFGLYKSPNEIIFIRENY